MMKAKLSNSLHCLRSFLSKGYASVVSIENIDSIGNFSNLLKLWHLKLGHMSYRGIEKLNRRSLLGFKLKINSEFCETFVMGKQACVKFETGQYSTPAVLDYICSDLWGPAIVLSKGRHKYLYHSLMIF